MWLSPIPNTSALCSNTSGIMWWIKQGFTNTDILDSSKQPELLRKLLKYCWKMIPFLKLVERVCKAFIKVKGGCYLCVNDLCWVMTELDVTITYRMWTRVHTAYCIFPWVELWFIRHNVNFVNAHSYLTFGWNPHTITVKSIKMPDQGFFLLFLFEGPGSIAGQRPNPSSWVQCRSQGRMKWEGCIRKVIWRKTCAKVLCGTHGALWRRLDGSSWKNNNNNFLKTNVIGCV